MARVSVRDVDRDPFEVLGVTPGASVAEIRTAYRRLAKELHPDRHGADGAAVAVQRRMAEVNRAYARLVDPDAAPTETVGRPPAPGRGRGRATTRAPGPDECEVCGHAPVTTATLVRQRGTGWGARRLSYERRLCRSCGDALATDALGRSLARGWWGPVALVEVVATVRTDLAARARFRALSAPRHVPGVRGVRATPLPSPRPLWTTAMGLMAVLVAATILLVTLLR